MDIAVIRQRGWSSGRHDFSGMRFGGSACCSLLHVHAAIRRFGKQRAVPGDAAGFGAVVWLQALFNKVLPVKLPAIPWPIGTITLKDRTISPVTQLFIDC